MQVFFVMNFLCLAPTHSDWARWDTLVFYCWPKWQRRLPQTNSLSTSIRQNSGQGSLTWQCYQGDNIVIRSALALNGSYCSQQQQHLSIPLYKQSCLKFHSFVYAVSDAVAHIFKGYYWYSYVCICHFESGSVWSFRRSVVHRFILFPFVLFSRTNSTRAWQGILWSPPYLTRLWCVPLSENGVPQNLMVEIFRINMAMLSHFQTSMLLLLELIFARDSDMCLFANLCC